MLHSSDLRTNCLHRPNRFRVLCVQSPRSERVRFMPGECCLLGQYVNSYSRLIHRPFCPLKTGLFDGIWKDPDSAAESRALLRWSKLIAGAFTEQKCRCLICRAPVHSEGGAIPADITNELAAVNRKASRLIFRAGNRAGASSHLFHRANRVRPRAFAAA